MTQAPILICGGGIGGAAAALALGRAGRRVELFERATSFAEVGAGIQLGPNVFAMFERLGIHADILALAARPGAMMMRCAIAGHEITRVDLGPGFAEHFGQPYATIYRPDLHGVLLDACRRLPGVTLHTGRAVAGFDQNAGGVTLHLEDGTSVHGAALIGADGLWSRIRDQLMGDEKPTVSGHIAYRAVLPWDQVPAATRVNDVVLWGGPRVHLVHYPLRRGELMNLVAVFHSDAYSEGWNAEGDASLLWHHFAATRPEVRDLLGRIETWRYWVLCDREPRRGWTRGRVTLLGDAAHPMLQYLAQGAGMAIEDAVCLADQIQLVADIPAALAAYEDARVLRTARAQLTARFYGEIYHAAGVKGELRDLLLSGRDPHQAREGMAWLYDPPTWPR